MRAARTINTVKLLPYLEEGGNSSDSSIGVERKITTALSIAVVQRDTQKLKTVTLKYPIKRLSPIPTPLYDCPGCATLHNELYNRYIALVHNYEDKHYHEYYDKMKHAYRFHHVVNH